MQLVEIAKALSLDARLLILDEPTSSLTLTETDRLLRVIDDLKAAGVCVVLISHRLNEVERCADRVVVLRDGRRVGELARAEIDHAAMIRLMIGRDLKALYLPPAAPPGDAVLELRGVRTADLSRAAGRPVPAPGRDPGPGRAGRRRPQRAGAGRVRHRPAAWAARSPSTGSRWRSEAPRDAIAPRDLPGARGPQALRAAARRLDRREHRPAGSRQLRARGHRAPRRRDRQRRAAADRASASRRRRSRPRSAASRAATSRRSCWPNGCRCARGW